MVYVPRFSPPVIPRHSRIKLQFDVTLKLGNRASKIRNCGPTFLPATNCNSESGSQNGRDTNLNIVADSLALFCLNMLLSVLIVATAFCSLFVFVFGPIIPVVITQFVTMTFPIIALVSLPFFGSCQTVRFLVFSPVHVYLTPPPSAAPARPATPNPAPDTSPPRPDSTATVCRSLFQTLRFRRRWLSSSPAARMP